MDDLLLGAGLGLLVALQVGPMSVLLVRTTLRRGARVGVGIALGIALVDAAYAGLGAAGVAAVLGVRGVELAAGLVGAVVLVALGAQSLAAARAPVESAERSAPATFSAALRLAVVATAANPLTIASWGAAFAAASAGARARPVPLVAGVGLGSLGWLLLLTAGTSLLRRGLPEGAVRVVDAVAGVGLVAAGLALGVRVLA